MNKNIIIGGGVAGLGATFASEFKYPIYERNPYSGGLCHSFYVDSFMFDTCVHLSFAKNQMVRDVFDKTPHFTYNPYPKNWYKDRWIKHPVQNNLFVLNAEERLKAIMGFIDRPKSGDKIKNFADWATYQFGEYIAEQFTHKYNTKYWCEDLDKLGVDWINNRLYQPSIEEVIYGALTAQTENTYYATEMRYPKFGGYEGFICSLIAKSNIFNNKEVCAIDTARKIISFSDGSTVEYNKVFSSLPLVDIIKMMENVPNDILNAANTLNYTSVAIVSVGIKKPKVIDDIWFYIYDDDIMAARVNSPSNKSLNNAPDVYSSLQFEIYFNGREDAPNKDVCIKNVLYALEKMGLAATSEVLFTDYRVQKYANVIMYPHNNQARNKIHDFLKSHDIIPIGRFGEWDYLWSDQAFLSGYNSVLTSGVQ